MTCGGVEAAPCRSPAVQQVAFADDPSSLPSDSTTGTPLIPRSDSSFARSCTRVSGPTVITFAVITSLARIASPRDVGDHFSGAAAQCPVPVRRHDVAGNSRDRYTILLSGRQHFIRSPKPDDCYLLPLFRGGRSDFARSRLHRGLERRREDCGTNRHRPASASAGVATAAAATRRTGPVRRPAAARPAPAVRRPKARPGLARRPAPAAPARQASPAASRSRPGRRKPSGSVPRLIVRMPLLMP